jgi:hypothetical protein
VTYNNLYKYYNLLLNNNKLISCCDNSHDGDTPEAIGDGAARKYGPVELQYIPGQAISVF